MADAAVMLFAGAKVVDAADAVVKYCCILKLLLLKTHNKRKKKYEETLYQTIV